VLFSLIEHHHILDISSRGRWVVSFTPRPLYRPGKEPLVPIRWEAGWAPKPVWTRWRKERFPSL